MPPLLRVALALLVSLLVGAYSDRTLAHATPLDLIISDAVLAAPPLLAIFLDPRLRNHRAALALITAGLALLLADPPLGGRCRSRARSARRRLRAEWQ